MKELDFLGEVVRILHTSDWHIGIHSGGVSRAPDHQLFFDWLIDTLLSEAIDVLVIAGDIYDVAQPSNEAQQAWYRLLAEVYRRTGVQVLVVGGNHDSPSFLETTDQPLDVLKVRVIGGLTQDDAGLQRLVVPLTGRDGQIGAVALAVPFVHEHRLGVRTTDDPALVKPLFEERFAALYRRLTDLARAQYPSLPILATGHLAMGQADQADQPRQIHTIGGLSGLSPDILDPRIQYLALGHIHSCYPVRSDDRAWYCGSPIPMSVREGASPRFVLRVELSADPTERPSVTPLEVPAFRALRKIEADASALIAALMSLHWSEPLPPLLYLTLLADSMPVGFDEEIQRTLSRFDAAARPVCVELRLQNPSQPKAQSFDEDVESLVQFEPIDVFHKLCEARAVSEVAPLDLLFSEMARLALEADDTQRTQALERIVGEIG